MTRFKGTIALDIDGTMTVHHRILEPPVKKYIENLGKQGWRLLFVTGRTFSFAAPIFQGFEQPYLIAVQNGAALFQMPGEQLKIKNYLNIKDIPFLEEILNRDGVGLLIESGRNQADICYYRPTGFSSEETDYLRFRMSISPEKWVGVDSLLTLPIAEFAVGKYFAKEDVAKKIASRVITASKEGYEVIVIRDPFRPGYHLALINAKGASKGLIVQQNRRAGYPLIVAGDDYNDVDMLKKADIKIVMGNAPKDMHPLGDIVAPPASEGGIIPALEEALRML